MVDFTTQDPVTLEDGSISIRFQATNGAYILNDALVLTADAFAAMSQADVDAETQRRWDNWFAIITASSEVTSDG